MAGSVDHLVILGSTLTSLALARHCRALDLACHVIDTRRGPAAQSKIPEVTILDGADPKLILDSVIRIAKARPSALIADSDAWIRWLIEYRHQLEPAFEVVIHPENDVLEACLDKSRFLDACREHGLPAPRHFDMPRSDQSLDLTYPLLVRPRQTRHGLASKIPKAVEISDDREMSELMAEYKHAGATATISESLLRDRIRQFSIGLARNRHGEVKAVVAEKLRPPPEWCAGGTYVVTNHVADVHELAVAAANKFGLMGIAEIEILKDEDTGEMFLIEINPRPWVQYALSWESGYDLLTFVLDPRRYDSKRERTSGQRWISFRDDLYVVLSRSQGMVKAGKLSVAQYIRDVISANVYAYWSLNDLRPWLSKVLNRFGKVTGR